MIKHGAAIVRVRAAMIEPGAAIVRATAAIVKHGASFVRVKAAMIERGAAIVRATAAIVKHRASFVRARAAMIEPGAAIVRARAAIVNHRASFARTKAAMNELTASITRTIDEIVEQKGEIVEHEAVSRTSTPTASKAMTTITKTNHRSLVSLKLPTAVAALIIDAEAIVRAMTGNPEFPTPVPALAVITQAIADLQAAEAAALARTKGAVVTRNEKKIALVKLLQQLKGYVQTVADANVDNGASIISNAGLAVRKVPTRTPRVFAAKPGKVSGSALLVAASAARRSSYEWEYSLDGGKTWVITPVTLQAKSTIAGLTPGATVTFRYRPVLKTGEGDWSQSVTLIIK